MSAARSRSQGPHLAEVGVDGGHDFLRRTTAEDVAQRKAAGVLAERAPVPPHLVQTLLLPHLPQGKKGEGSWLERR